MAQKGDELNTRITASDDASAGVDRVREKVADLEDREHNVDLGADTDEATRKVTSLDDRLDGLTKEERRVVLDFMASDAQRDIDRINRELARAQKYDDTEISVRVNAKGDAQRRLDEIQSEIREIDGATPDIRPRVDSSELDSFVDKLEEVSGFGGLGRLRGASGAAGIGAGVAGAFVLAADAAADAAIQVDNVAKLTGDSVENASRLAGVMGSVGVEITDLQDILLQMGGVLADDAELAAQLGINMNDGRTLGERFVQVVERLGDRYTDTSERSLVASRLFGEEGVRQVNAVTAAYDDLGKAVEEYNGSVFTAQEVEAARRYKGEVAELKNEFVQLRNEIGGSVVPVLGDALSLVNDFNSLGGGEGGILGTAFKASGLGLINDYNSAVVGFGKSLFGLSDETRNAKAAFETLLPAVDEIRRQLDPTLLDKAISDLRDRVNLAASDEELTSWRMVNDSIELAASNVRRFGTDGVEQMNAIGDAADDTAEKISGIAAAASEERSVLSLADQWDRVVDAAGEYWAAQQDDSKSARTEQRAYRDELLTLFDDVLRFAQEVGDIPDQKLVSLKAAIDDNDLGAIERALDAIFTDRTIRLDVTQPDPSRFRRNEDGSFERTTDSSARVTNDAPQSVTYLEEHHHYSIAPTPLQTDSTLRDYQFANGGSRAR